MNDETKGAIEWLRTLDEDDRDYYDAQRILAHIDGEPARRAAAREEQREACALDAEERVGCASTYDEIRSVPLDATPLADELRTLRARVAELEATNDAEWEQAAYLANDRAKKAEAEREALLARRCDAYSLLRPEFDGVTFCRKDGARAAQDVLAERDALRAQVEAARTYARQALDYGEDCDATDLLAAMDGAKP